MKTIACAVVLLAGPGFGHRLDEYLQATIITIEKDRVQAQMRLTPGVAVASFVVSGIDSNGDGAISETEQRRYAERVLREISLTIDGAPLRPELISVEFPAVEAMREGLGEILIGFRAELPRGGSERRLVFENHHESRIAAYLVNCLVPGDRNLRIVGQNRNEQQSVYRVDYEQAGVSSGSLPFTGGGHEWLILAGLVMLGRLAYLWRRGRLGDFLGAPRQSRQCS